MARSSLTPEQKHHQQVQKDVDWLKNLSSTLGLRKTTGKVVLHYKQGRLCQIVEERCHYPPS